MSYASLTLPTTIVSAALMSIAVSASAQDAPTEKQLASAVEARHAHMGLNGFNLGILGAMAKSETPYDAETATAAASNLVALASGIDQSIYWLPGSAAGAVEGSRALPAIWEDPQGFLAAEAAMMEAAVAMQAAAGQNLEALQAQMGGVGQACNECHKAYRQPR